MKKYNRSRGLIYISGGGSADDSRLIDVDFVNNLPINAKILYLPFASEPKNDGYTKNIEWLTSTLKDAGYNHKLDIYTKQHYKD